MVRMRNHLHKGAMMIVLSMCAIVLFTCSCYAQNYEISRPTFNETEKLLKLFQKWSINLDKPDTSRTNQSRSMPASLEDTLTFPLDALDSGGLLDVNDWDDSAIYMQIQGGNSPAVVRQPASIQESVNPRLAGFICNSDGVTINSESGFVFYSSQMAFTHGETVANAATTTLCQWSIALPLELEAYQPFFALNVNNFSSSDSAILKIYSGKNICEDDDNLYGHMILKPNDDDDYTMTTFNREFMRRRGKYGGNQDDSDNKTSEIVGIEDTFVFVPPTGMAVTIQLEIDISHHRHNPLYRPTFLLDMEFETIDSQEMTLESLPDDKVYLQGSLNIQAEEDLFNISSFLNENLEGINGVDGGIYITDNYDLKSLDGIQNISYVNGPIVIRNNVHLMTPLSWVVDWLNGLAGNITSLDLSFNRFSGEIPDSICDLVDNSAYNINLRNNLILCGNLPECINLDLGDSWGEKRLVVATFDEEGGVNSGYANEHAGYASAEYTAPPDYSPSIWKSPELQIGRNYLAGNNIMSSCSSVDRVVEEMKTENRSIMGCSPLGYVAELGTKGEIIFDHRSLVLESANPPSCTWQWDVTEYADYESMLYIEFEHFYTSVSPNRGSPCNDFSSGHNFYNPILNGPIIEEFVVTIFSDVYDSGYDIFRYSGSDSPSPFVLPIYTTTQNVQVALKEKNTWKPPPHLLLDNTTVEQELVQCGRTMVKYSLVKPLSDLKSLQSFVSEHLDADSGVLDESVFISGCSNTSDLRNMSALAGVKKINGALAIVECQSLNSFAGLDNLKHITKSFSIYNNQGLSSLKGLSSLERIDGALVLYMLDELNSLQGLEGLQTIGKNLLIQFTGIESMDGLQNLSTVGNVDGAIGVTFKYNNKLTSLSGLSSLRNVNTVKVLYNPVLTDLSGLELLEKVNGTIDIQHNPLLENVNGLGKLTYIGGSLGIFHNPRLESIDALQKLHTVRGSMAISKNDALKTIDLPSMKYIGSHAHMTSDVDDDRELIIDHILAITYNNELTKVNFDNLIIAPTNVFIAGNEKLSGFLPTYLIAKDNVMYANFEYNNFTGPIDPSICNYTFRFEYLKVTGNQYVCGDTPQCDIRLMSEGTNLFEACPNALPPVCTAQGEDKCAVVGAEYSSDPTELFFAFPAYTVPKVVKNSFNTSIAYEFGVGTKPGLDDVSMFTAINHTEQNNGSVEYIEHAWSLQDRHISMLNGQRYYVTVNAYDTLGMSSSNITSNGTLIDVMPPDTSNAKVILQVKPNGQYKVDWKNFESLSGITRYLVMLYENEKLRLTEYVIGSNSSLSGNIPKSEIKNGTSFMASVTGVSGAGLKSSPVDSSSVIPLTGKEEDDSDLRLLVAVVVGVTLGLLIAAAIVAYFVARYIRKQKKEEQQREWYQRLNHSLYNYLQGSDQAGKGSEDDVESVQLGLFDMTNNDSKDAIFVFTDIENSTHLCEQNANVFIELQEIHDEIIRNALAETGGYEVDTEGDAFQCLFSDVAHALNFCFMVQTDLLTYNWPVSILSLHGCEKDKSSLNKGTYIWGGPKVRMAVHFGFAGNFWVKPHPTTRRLTCGGMAWEFTKMLSDVGHGGQVLVSESAWKQLVNAGAEGAAGYPIFEDLGFYQLDSQDCPSMRILQASPARSPLSERQFSELRNVLLLDQGRGLNIVSPPEGKVALIAVVSTEIYRTSMKAIIEELAIFHQSQGVADMSPFDANYYESIGEVTKTNFRDERSLTLRDIGQFLGSMASSKKSNLNVEMMGPVISRIYNSAFAIVESVLISLVSQFGGYVIETVEGIQIPDGCMIIAFRSSSAAARFALASQTTLMEYPWPNEILNLPGMKQRCCRKDGTPFFSGPRVAMSGHVAVLEKYTVGNNKISQRSALSLTESRQSVRSTVDIGVTYRINGILETLELAHMTSGGQIILSSKFFDSHWQRGLSLSQTHITDLGVHDVKYFDGPLNLIEILPKVLERRSDSFRPVPSERMLSVGARQAPGRQGENIALVFTYPKVAQSFQRSGLASNAVDNFSESVRLLLSRYNGYESQEVGTGCFFLSFPSLEDALAWSVHIQLILRRSEWNNADTVMSELDADEGKSESSFFDDLACDTLFSSSESALNFVASGLNLKDLVLAQIGIVYGKPTKVTSHVQTGRADYFGPIVNLTARVAKSTQPGEIHASSTDEMAHIEHCTLKGNEFANHRQKVSINFHNCGSQSFKGVKERHNILTLKICGDPFRSTSFKNNMSFKKYAKK